LRAHGRWLSPDTPAASTTKTGRHDIAEILLKVALNTKKSNQLNLVFAFVYLFQQFEHNYVVVSLLPHYW
jgi:hypothetical protein